MTLRRAPMPPRRQPMKRTPIVRQAAPLSSSPLRDRPRGNMRPEFRVARGLSFRRSGGLCVVCGCSAQHGHHRHRRSQGGPDTEANVMPVCTACHGKIHTGWSVRTPDDRREHRAALAIRMGWLIRVEDLGRPLVPWWELPFWVNREGRPS